MTIEAIPAQSFSSLFHIAVLAVALLVLLACLISRNHGDDPPPTQVLGYCFVAFVTLFIGLRPVSGAFVDMVGYARLYDLVRLGVDVPDLPDPLFNALLHRSADVVGAPAFFLLCAALYVLPLYFACAQWFGPQWFLGFLMIVSITTFWAYGVNGIRNGIATSLFIFALSRRHRLSQAAWMLVAAGFHLSLIIPAAAYLTTLLVRRSGPYFVAWLACIPLSLVFGSFFQGLFGGLDINDDRVSYLLVQADASIFRFTGFRWDFLLYSSIAVAAGWFYIYRKRVADPRYVQLLSVFLASNGGWLLVIDSNYSNRFAYLSWFLIGPVLVYPLLASRLTVQRGVKAALIVTASAVVSLALSFY